MLNVLAFALSRSSKPFNARPIWLLRCSIRCYMKWFAVSRLRTDWQLGSTDITAPLA